jgi:hypothetical protein
VNISQLKLRSEKFDDNYDDDDDDNNNNNNNNNKNNNNNNNNKTAVVKIPHNFHLKLTPTERYSTCVLRINFAVGLVICLLTWLALSFHYTLVDSNA